MTTPKSPGKGPGIKSRIKINLQAPSPSNSSSSTPKVKRRRKARSKPSTVTSRSGSGGAEKVISVVDEDAVEIDDLPDGFWAGLTSEDAEERKDENGAGPSRPRKATSPIKPHIGSPRSGEEMPEHTTVSSFLPMPRSILSGMARLSASPERPGRTAKSRSRSPAYQADIIIDEQPDPGDSSGKFKNGSSRAGHFDPPGLFGTSMMPEITTSSSGSPQVELRRSEAGDKETIASGGKKEQDGALLLPSHVLLDSPIGVAGHATDEEMEGQEQGSSMEGLHFLDDDVTRGVQRYFDPEEDAPQTAEATFLANADQSKICQNCKRPGHRSKACPHTICTTCGAEDKHDRRDCPFGLVCFSCGTPGHRSADCPNSSNRSKRNGCDRCGARDHMEASCPTLWRIYSYLSKSERAAQVEERESATGWAQEAVGGGAREAWCYNCAKEGHFGDDCNQRRGSLARFAFPSAFSHLVASRGPYSLSNPNFSRSSNPNSRHPNPNLPAKPNFAISSLPGSSTSSPSSTPRHQRWTDTDDEWGRPSRSSRGNDELPFLTPGFEGSHAGRKTREKQRNRLQQLEREAGEIDDNDEEGDAEADEAWLHRRKRKPWDSERKPSPDRTASRSRGESRNRHDARGSTSGRDRELGLPFGHRHLMSSSSTTNDRADQYSTPSGRGGKRQEVAISSAPAKQHQQARTIQFGKFSASTQDRLAESPTVAAANGPSMSTPSGPGGRRLGDGSLALVNRALGGGGSNKRSNRASNTENGSPASPSPLSGMDSQPSTPISGSGSKKRHRERDREKDERDWENEWRRSGKGGGPVSGWGEEMDQLEREGRRERGNGNGDNNTTRKGSGDGGGSGVGGGFTIRGKGGGRGGEESESRDRGRGRDRDSPLSIRGKGKSGLSGQRYHGGY